MRLILAALISAAMTIPAEAHMPLDGFGYFANGALHPLFIPAHVLVIAALALLSGRQGFQASTQAAGVFLAAVVCGLALGTSATIAAVMTESRLQAMLLSGAGIAGLAVAGALHVDRRMLLGAVALAAFGLGLDSGLVGRSAWETFQTYAGTTIAATIATLYLGSVAAEIFSARPHWMQIGVRIVGSWIAAISILVLALAFASPR